jgi:hypothetical protein
VKQRNIFEIFMQFGQWIWDIYIGRHFVVPDPVKLVNIIMVLTCREHKIPLSCDLTTNGNQNTKHQFFVHL